MSSCRTLSAVLALAVVGSVTLAASPRPGEPLVDWRSPGVERAELLLEDALNEALPGAVYRVGVPFDVELAPDRAGEWETLPSGDRIWRLSVHSPDALWLVLGMGKYNLQPGAELRLYSADRTTVLGPFTHENVRSHGELWFPPIDGDTVLIELDWPQQLAGETPNLVLTRVSHGYKPLDAGDPRDPLGESDPTRDLGDSGSCNIDVACALGNDWQDQEQGVVHILRGGTSWCSGSLIATTARDCQPLVLSAAHCFSAADAPSLTFRFNYERPTCGSGTPTNIVTVTGGTFRSRLTASDFYLVEMDGPPPLDADAYFNGWDRSGVAPTESWGIHHPRGDAKKISFNDDPLINGTNYGPNHWRVTEWEQGTTEPTSSGSPLFDQNKRIVGQLHGGTASCSSITWDEYGKVSSSWADGGSSSAQLSNWLDPAGTGELAIDGLPYAACLTPQPRLSLVTVTVDDSSTGNGDGVIDVGERVQLALEVGNVGGTLDATGVAGSLSPLTGGVTVPVADRTYPDLAQDATAYANGMFEIEVDASFACGDTIPLQLDMTANEAPGAWMAETTLATGTAVVNVAYQDSMESGTNGWTTAESTGTNAWSQTTAQSASPATSWFVADIASVSDAVLVSPAVVVPSGATLSFAHYVASESTFDGGVLEVSTDGTNWTDLGGSAIAGGYNSTISTQYSSPIGGRQAWSGTLGSGAAFAQVEVDLSAYVGQSVQLRWRFATDSSVSATGWYVDDVEISETTFDCTPALARPGEASDFVIDPAAGPGWALAWAAPTLGGPVESYRLYEQPLGNMGQLPGCVGDVGSATSTTLATLPDNSAFLIVAANAAGEGSYGFATAGERAPAAASCP